MRTHLDLCSGIGGFALAAKWSGQFTTTQFVEIDEFCQKVLQQNFPGVPIHGDIRTFEVEQKYDLVTAGFPCQPHSIAGKKKGSADERDLWSEIIRVIRGVKPRWVLLENVDGLRHSEKGGFFRRILRDIAETGYDAEWDVISCAEIGGSHQRKRLWIVAYPTNIGRWSGSDIGERREVQDNEEWDAASIQEERNGLFSDARTFSQVTQVVTDTESSRWDSSGSPSMETRTDIASKCGSDNTVEWVQTFTDHCRSYDGLSNGVHGSYLMPPRHIPLWLPYASDNYEIPDRKQRLRALGNAIVPHIAYNIIRRM